LKFLLQSFLLQSFFFFLTFFSWQPSEQKNKLPQLDISPLVDLIRSKDFQLNSSSLDLADQLGFGQQWRELLLAFSMQTTEKDPLQFALNWVCEFGHVELLKVLLMNERLDPSHNDQEPFRNASKEGHVEVVKLLLADKRVDPSADSNYAIRYASEKGHSEVVKLLLADKRVDPSDGDNYAIRYACECGFPAVVELLLKDPRVDPSVDDHVALKYASEYGHVDVVKLMLADQRVVISVSSLLSTLPSSTRPEILSLFLLRRSFRSQLYVHPSVLADIEKIESQRKAFLDVYLLSELSSLCLDYVPDLFCHVSQISSLMASSKTRYPVFSLASLSSL
jgi:hypothetical protein